jgi:hyperpolarization activated cyclic nucleotide-gated potassium channel 2
MSRRRGAPIYRLFDNVDHRVCYTSTSVSLATLDGDDDLENATESLAIRPVAMRLLFSHFSLWRRLWEYVIFITCLLPLWELTFAAIFLDAPPGLSFFIPFMLFDVVFAIDIYTIFHTSYLSYGVLIHSPRRIVDRYGRNWFIVHCVAAIPFSWFSLFTDEWLYYLVLASPRLLRLHRAIVANETFRRILIYESWSSVMVPLLAVWFLFMHFVACLFHVCARIESIEKSWIALHGWDGRNGIELYVVSTYFSFVTLLGPGCGDITPQTSSEIFLIIFVQLVGVSVNAFLLGRVVGLIMKSVGDRFLHQYISFRSLLEFMKIDISLAREISHYFSHKWMTDRGADDPNQVYRQIPETIRNHLKRDMCEWLLEKVATFRMADDAFRILTARIMKFVEFVPGEEIIRQGDINPDLLLLSAGFVDVFMDDVKFAGMVNCADGQYFGEQELFADLPRSSTIRAVTHVSGWRLSREDFRIAVGSKPDMKEQVLGIVRFLFPDFLDGVGAMFADGEINALRVQHVSDASDSDSGEIGIAMREPGED